MVATSIRHGDLVIDMQTDGTVQMSRPSNGMCFLLSLTEWKYLMAVAELHGWPIVPPQQPPLGSTT